MFRITKALAGATILLITTVACVNPAAEAVPLSEDTVVLDVRTAEEYAAGHLDGARLLDFTGGQFVAVLPKLDPHAEYLLYCRSGNRSGQATKLMEDAGFTNVTNLGSLEQAAEATQLPIVP